MSEAPPRILVVDDEPGMREGCRKVLSPQGYAVETAEDGPTALAALREGPAFDAALIDLKMPGMDGLELIRHIREQDQDIVLFVITAYATIDTAVKATRLGAFDYIPKPFTPHELLLPVRNGLERRSLALEARRLREDRERRLLELAFERSKCHTIINCMADGVLVVNRDRQVVLRNAAAERILPTRASPALPAPLDQALGCPELLPLVRRALASPAVPSIASAELALGERTYMAHASPVPEGGGEVAGAVVVLRDVTALKTLETAKSMFVSMVAHEVKRPLAAIEGYLNVILNGAAGQDAQRDRQMLERCRARARGLRTMLSELMSLVAMQTGSFTVERVPTCLAKVVTAAVDSCREAAQQGSVALSLHCAEGADAAMVLADEQAMHSVFVNLIDNALKFTPESGRVEVRVERDAGRLNVSVRDNGAGMTAEEQGRAFDEFFRANHARTAQVPGAGLGLSIVKQLVDLHQGRVAVQSGPGEGSTFTVSLPALPPRPSGEPGPAGPLL